VCAPIVQGMAVVLVATLEQAVGAGSWSRQLEQAVGAWSTPIQELTAVYTQAECRRRYRFCFMAIVWRLPSAISQVKSMHEKQAYVLT